MRSRRLLSVCLVAAQTLIGQTRVSLKTQGKEVDFSQATGVRPFQMGTTLPATCNTGEMFFKTDAPAGANLYGCVGGTWVPQGGAPTLAGDVTGPVGSTVVERIRGHRVSAAAPSSGQVLTWNAVTAQWEPATVSGAATGQVPLEVTRVSAAQLAIGSNCSPSSPCVVRFGAVAYTYTAPATATVTSGGGTAYLYVAHDGSLMVGIPATGMSVSCTGCNVVVGVTAFPADSIPLYTWSAASAQWSTSGTDWRATLSAGRRFVAGAGISLAESGATVTISATGSGGGSGSGYTTVQDEGTGLAQRATLNFVGGGVSCADDATGGRTTCSVPNDAGGDLSGTLVNATVTRLHGRPLAATAPSDGQVLTWSGANGQWEPRTPTGGGMPVLFLQKMIRLALPGNFSIHQLGFNFNVDGSQSGVGATASMPHSAIRYTSGATSGSDAGLTSPFPLAVFRRGEVFRAYVGIGSTSNLRWWLGMSHLAGGEMGTDVPGHALAMFRYSTSAADTTFKCVTCSGGSGNCTVTDSGVTADTNRHLFEISWTGTAYQFRIDNNLVCTNATNLPGNGVTYGVAVRLRTLENASKFVDVGGLYLENNF
ncbi:MAG: hypothetical protein RMK57_12725 [Bryobacterales bacterium]|nr:hypothetical protein [Bryobacteraceae bacterium]MDW8355381.1 hypothetical protein [Bryobacterales bacterium]